MKNRIIDHERDLLRAIALYYDQINDPVVVAKGEGKIATAIIQTGKNHHIHLHEDPNLMEQLSHLDIGDSIPQQLYQIIAEIIAFVYMLEGKTPEEFNPEDYQ